MATPHKSACSRPAASSHPARTLPMQQRQVFSCSLCNLTLPFEVPTPPHPSFQFPPGCILQYCTCRRPYQPLRASSPTFACSSMADAPPGPNKSHSLRTRAPPILSPETFHNDHPHQSPCRYMRKDSFGGDNGVLCLGSRCNPPVPLHFPARSHSGSALPHQMQRVLRHRLLRAALQLVLPFANAHALLQHSATQGGSPLPLNPNLIPFRSFASNCIPPPTLPPFSATS